MKYIISNETSNSILLKVVALIIASLIVTLPLYAQDVEEGEQQEEKKKERPERRAFESAWWFDGQTGVVYDKKTLEMVINHRFGTIKSGNNDIFGIYGSSNIRLGFAYAPINHLNVGFGYTKNNKVMDLYAKYAILTQTRSNSMPITLTYHGVMGIQVNTKNNYLNPTDRFSYFNQLLIMRRFSSKFSAQIGPSLSHFNAVAWEEQEDGSWNHINNDTWGINAGIRYKFTPSLILMLGYDQPLTQQPINQPKPSINLGIEIATSSHAFQVFVTNYNRITPQDNYVYNTNDFTKTGDGGVWLIGFNMTRLWSF